MKLDTFLSQKPLYYAKIDYTRMPRAYESIKGHVLIPPIIHVVGTNGKGTTGRFLSLMLKQCGFRVGHYTSPHVFEFNERIWIDGKPIDSRSLESLYVELSSMLSEEFLKELSYFEYTTFLAALAFRDCDMIVMEAGLGGEYDATNVFEKRLSIITPIGMDHEALLGDSIFEIATTKLNSINKTTVLATQRYDEVVNVAKDIASKQGVELLHVKDLLSEEVENDIKSYCKKYKYPSFFEQNLSTAYVASKTLGVEVDFTNLVPIDILGRCYRYNSNVIVDCGHNELAALALSEQFDKKSKILVYNSYADKNFAKILEILKPIVKRVEIIEVKDDDRIVDIKQLQDTISLAGLKWSIFESTCKDEDYLVFGSFKVVETFLGRVNEK